MATAKIPKELQLSEDQYALWMGRIKRAYTARDEMDVLWERMSYYKKGLYESNGLYGGATWDDEHRVEAAWHLSNVRQSVAQLYFQHPRMNFTAKAARAFSVVKPLEILCSYEREFIKVHLEERRALEDNHWFGTGILKYSWNAQYGESQPISDDFHKTLDTSMGSVLHEDMKLPQGAATEHNPNVWWGHPSVQRIAPWDFLIDPEASTFDDARWFAHRFRRPWVSAVNDARWIRKARKDLSPSGPGKFFDTTATGGAHIKNWKNSPEAVDSSLVTFYEIFDRTTQRIIVVSDSTTSPLMVRPYPFFGRRGPYVLSSFIEQDDSPWGFPWAEVFTPQALALNTIRTQMMNHMQRLGVARGVYMKDAANKEDIDRMANSTIGDFTPLQGDRPISEILQMFPAIPITPDMYRLADVFKSDMGEMSGVSENQRGGGTGINTATEASIVAQQSGLRTGDMRFVVDQMLRDSTNNIMTLLRRFWTDREVIPIVGQDGQFWELAGKDLGAEFDVNVEPGSTERVDRNARRQQSIELLGQLPVIMQLLASQGATINLVPVVKSLLENSDVTKNADRIVIEASAPPQPGALGGAAGTASQTAGPGAVGPRDNVIAAQDSFQSGRLLSDQQRRK